MATLVVNPTVTSDATLFSQNVNYTTAHDALTGTVNTAGYSWAGQYLFGGVYEVARTALFFDTSGLGGGATVTGATLSLKGQADVSTTDFNLTIVSGDDLTDRLVAADFGDMLDNVTSYGLLNTSGWLVEDWNSILLNPAGLAAISLTGTTKFGFRSSLDISPTAPANDEEVFWYNGLAFADQLPILTITYTTGFVPKIFFF